MHHEYTWSSGHVSSELSCGHVEHFDPTYLFQSQVRQQQVLQGNRRHFMAWINSLSINHLISKYHIMWFTSMSMIQQIIFVPFPLPPFGIKWCHIVHRIKWCFSFLYFCHHRSISTMAILRAQPDLQTLFEPILQTQRELARAHEIICQVDDLSDYTDDNHLQQASLHLVQVRHRLRAVITLLKLRLTIQMIQLARFFRNHFRQTYNIPIVNLDFQWLLLDRSLALGLPKARARRKAISELNPSRQKDACADSDLSAWRHTSRWTHGRNK